MRRKCNCARAQTLLLLCAALAANCVASGTTWAHPKDKLEIYEADQKALSATYSDFRKGNFCKVITTTKSLMDKEDLDADEVLTLRAQAFEAIKNFPCAIATLKECVEFDNAKFPTTFAALSRVYEKSGDYSSALKAIQKAIQLAPAEEDYKFVEAGLQAKLHHCAEAQAILGQLKVQESRFPSESGKRNLVDLGRCINRNCKCKEPK